MSHSYSLYELLIKNDIIEVPRIFLIIALLPIFVIFLLYTLSFDKIDFKMLKSKLPEIISMTQRVENIKLNLQLYLEKSVYSDEIQEEITEKTQLTYNQFVFFNYIKELEEIQKMWDEYSYNELINNSNIKMPYAIAYNIREILGTEIIKDDDNEDNVWLYQNERACLKKYKMYDPNAQPHLENPDHVVICMECRKNVTKESIKNSNYSYNIDEATTPPLAEEHNCEKEESKEESNEKDETEKGKVKAI
jgi:hypothetical protein